MLRLTVLLLLLANAAYFAWSQGYLLPWGMGPAPQSEPHRLGQQIRPEAVRVLRPEEVSRLEALPPPIPTPPPVATPVVMRPAECLLAAPLEDSQVEVLRPLLASWPATAWTLEPMTEPGRWVVYMGKYNSAEQLGRKKAELRKMGIAFEPLANPALEPGLSLGAFATEADAARGLKAIAAKGVRTARVVQERPELIVHRLTLPAVDDALRPRLDELRPALNGKLLRSCR